MRTENKSDEISSQLSNLKEILSAVTNMMPDRHFIINKEGMIINRFGNVLSEQFYNYEHSEVHSITELTNPENTHKALTAIAKSLTTQQVVTFEISMKLSDIKEMMPNAQGPNEQQWFEVRMRPLEFVIDNKEVLIVSSRNITERKLYEIKLHELVVTDPLTQIFNRRYATDELSRCFQRFLRYKTDITVLMLDIDFFKKINDNYGHDIGDLVLIELSKFLKENLRNVDIIARIGGEEFIVIMPDVALNKVQPVCERLINNIAKLQIPIEEGSISITVSGGLSQFVKQDTSIETILKRVDVALYQSKKEGRNRITLA